MSTCVFAASNYMNNNWSCTNFKNCSFIMEEKSNCLELYKSVTLTTTFFYEAENEDSTILIG